MVTTPSVDNWIVKPKPNPQAEIRLFCFPYAGGGALPFRTWSNDLPSEIEVCAVQLPGRENRLNEPPIPRLSPLVQTLARVLLPSLDKPFAFFGHSMGALIGFELVRHLRSQKSPVPIHLFVSGCKAPQIPDTDSPLHDLPSSLLIEKLRSYNGTPEAVLQDHTMMQLLLPVIRADFAIIETYVYSKEEPLNLPISAFGGFEDSSVSHEQLAEWRNQTSRSFELQMLRGNHFFLHAERALLLKYISRDLRSYL
jgi:medium-chain acyl-[acyl-carrier-protein] hydrolase